MDETDEKDRSRALSAPEPSKPKGAAAVRERSEADPTQASDRASDTEKHEQNVATPEVCVGRLDVSDTLGSPARRAASVDAKGAAGRKRQKC